MKILVYANPTKTSAIKRIFSLAQVWVESCSSSEQFLHLCMVEQYAAVFFAEDYSEKELVSLYIKWKSQGCSSLFAVLTSDQSAMKRARLLELGVDFYFIEPCSYQQIILSLREKDRHTTMIHSIYRKDNFQIDYQIMRIYYRNQEILLSKKEFAILSYLVRNCGIVLTRMQVWEEVWGFADYPLGNTIDVHVTRIRKKLANIESLKLETSYGIGYCLLDSAQPTRPHLVAA